jgi:hypothetical protein
MALVIPFLKMNNSDKDYSEFEVKKDKQNVWFGVYIDWSWNRFQKTTLEEALIWDYLKEIKLFYLADYNNSGDKATDQVVMLL